MERAAVDKLVVKAKKGDRAAFKELVELYQGRAYAIAFNLLRSKEDAEDVIQEAFVKAYLNLKDFRGESAFYTWFYRIVYRMAIDLVRHKKRRGGVALELDEDRCESGVVEVSNGYGVAAMPERMVSGKEELVKLAEALGQLTEEHRAIILLREVHGLSYSEISESVGITKGTVMSRLFYARKKIQEIMGKEDSEDLDKEIVSGDGQQSSQYEEGEEVSRYQFRFNSAVKSN